MYRPVVRMKQIYYIIFDVSISSRELSLEGVWEEGVGDSDRVVLPHAGGSWVFKPAVKISTIDSSVGLVCGEIRGK